MFSSQWLRGRQELSRRGGEDDGPPLTFHKQMMMRASRRSPPTMLPMRIQRERGTTLDWITSSRVCESHEK